MKEQQLRELVLKWYRRLALGMITHGEMLEVDARVRAEKGAIEISTRAHREDHGRIVGKQGKTFNALKLVMSLVGHRNGYPVRLNFLETPIHGERASFLPPMTPNEKWKSDELQALLSGFLKLILNFPFELEAIENETEHKTSFILQIDRREELPLVSTDLVKNLSTIFNVIGNAKGRHVTVHTERPKDERGGIVAAAGKRIGENRERF